MEDPGTAPWTPVPRDQVASACGLDPDVLDQASPQLQSTPFVVIRHGKLCWQGGAQPHGTTEQYAVYSVTKTFGAMLFGMVSDRSSVLSDMSLAKDWIAPEKMSTSNGTINPKARIVHILGMVSTNADLSYGKKGAWSYDTFGSREVNNLEDIMNKAIAAEPDKFGGAKNVVEFAQKALFDPLGMKDTTYPGGNLASKLESSVMDMARLGQLVLQRGVWHGKRIISEEYLYKMTHPSFEDANTGYGYLTYVNAAANWSWPTSTADTYCAPYGEWPSYPHRPLFDEPNANGGVPGNRPQKYDEAHTFASGTGGQKFIIMRGVDTVVAIRNGAYSVGDGGTAVDQFAGHKTVWNAMRPAMLKLMPEWKDDEAGFCAAYKRSDIAPDMREPWFAEQQQPAAGSGGQAGGGGQQGTAPSSGAPQKVQPTCTSTREFLLRLGRRGIKVKRISVLVNGKRAKVLRGKRIRAIIDLRGKGPGLSIVRIVVSGKRHGKRASYRRTKVYRNCKV